MTALACGMVGRGCSMSNRTSFTLADMIIDTAVQPGTFWSDWACSTSGTYAPEIILLSILVDVLHICSSTCKCIHAVPNSHHTTRFSACMLVSDIMLQLVLACQMQQAVHL